MPGRGRKSPKVDALIEMLARMAIRYKVEPSEFFSYVVEAWRSETSECEQVKITCRGKSEDSAVFLFTVGSDIIGQFPIPTQILKGRNRLEDYMTMISMRGQPVKRELKVGDLNPGMKYVNLEAKVLETPEPRVVETRWGAATVSNVLIGDETGTISMVLWNKQIDIVSEGALIEIRDARVDRFRGEPLLRIGKGGKIKLLERSKEMKR